VSANVSCAMGQSQELLISSVGTTRDLGESARPVSSPPRTWRSQQARPPPKPKPRPRPRKSTVDLLEAIKLEEKDRNGKSMKLVDAVKEGQDHLVLHLLQAGAPLDETDVEGFTPLARAVEARRPAIVSLLLKFGAPSEPGLFARAVQTAGYLGGQEIAFRLLPHTPQDHLNHPLEGRSALCWAVLRADLEMVEAILGRRPTLEGIKSVQSRTTSEVLAVLVKYSSSVPDLQDLATAVVREALAVGKAVNQVDKLPLPQRLLDLLKF